ncbi:DUF7260 family protein [Natrialba sp. SSL1]|uniref:DUF7260 family protein n=1 Tax=Natrialba sp. SSL1 TaxID=1869245 RepID=UPI0008F8F08C|nr:hypothetical protein [Natrialba sp. SSL1]OIB58571.1 hypothetical protein BBD46_07850 [Natrialba sp. SSL1]
MTVAVLQTALDRVAEEQAAVATGIRAFERFETGVEEIEPSTGVYISSSPAATTAPATASTTTFPDGGDNATPAASIVQHRPNEPDATARVRTLFAETVHPYSTETIDESEPLLETVVEELGPDIATALSPTTPAQFTPALKKAICTSADQRRTELDTMARVLERETASLNEAVTVVDGVLEWLESVDDTPLSSLGFEALRERHKGLAARRLCCGRFLEERQETLARTIAQGTPAKTAHREVVEYLYQEQRQSYPVLAAMVALDRLCGTCQRVVREHLVRRA